MKLHSIIILVLFAAIVGSVSFFTFVDIPNREKPAAHYTKNDSIPMSSELQVTKWDIYTEPSHEYLVEQKLDSIITLLNKIHQ